MLNAINDAGIKSSDIEYINAHGTSTPYNDKIETKAAGGHLKRNIFAVIIPANFGNRDQITLILYPAIRYPHAIFSFFSFSYFLIQLLQKKV